LPISLNLDETPRGALVAAKVFLYDIGAMRNGGSHFGFERLLAMNESDLFRCPSRNLVLLFKRLHRTTLLL